MDNLSNGRAGIAFATGFHPVDFILSPERLKERSKLTAEVVEADAEVLPEESAQGRTGTGEEVGEGALPKAGAARAAHMADRHAIHRDFVQAGRLGVNVLTAMLRITREEMAEKIAAYRHARSEHGHDPNAGKVTLMLHAFAGPDEGSVRAS